MRSIRNTLLAGALAGLVIVGLMLLAIQVASAHHGGDGPNGPNVIIGTAGPDKLVGGHGPDIIRARGGDDRIWLGRGPDIVYCGAGYDIVNTRAPGAEQTDTIARNCEELRIGSGPGPA